VGGSMKARSTAAVGRSGNPQRANPRRSYRHPRHRRRVLAPGRQQVEEGGHSPRAAADATTPRWSCHAPPSVVCRPPRLRAAAPPPPRRRVCPLAGQSTHQPTSTPRPMVASRAPFGTWDNAPRATRHQNHPPTRLPVSPLRAPDSSSRSTCPRRGPQRSHHHPPPLDDSRRTLPGNRAPTRTLRRCGRQLPAGSTAQSRARTCRARCPLAAARAGREKRGGGGAWWRQDSAAFTRPSPPPPPPPPPPHHTGTPKTLARRSHHAEVLLFLSPAPPTRVRRWRAWWQPLARRPPPMTPDTARQAGAV